MRRKSQPTGQLASPSWSKALKLKESNLVTRRWNAGATKGRMKERREEEEEEEEERGARKEINNGE